MRTRPRGGLAVSVVTGEWCAKTDSVCLFVGKIAANGRALSIIPDDLPAAGMMDSRFSTNRGRHDSPITVGSDQGPLSFERWRIGELKTQSEEPGMRVKWHGQESEETSEWLFRPP